MAKEKKKRSFLKIILIIVAILFVILIISALLDDGEYSDDYADSENTYTEKVGQFAAEIRDKRRPEPYKGKGIKYADETIRRKVGKTGKK